MNVECHLILYCLSLLFFFCFPPPSLQMDVGFKGMQNPVFFFFQKIVEKMVRNEINNEQNIFSTQLPHPLSGNT